MDVLPRDDLSRWVGQVVPFHFDPAILVVSYIVSLVGAASTLELVNRRTSRKGIYNHLLLLGAAMSMGGVAIWCMHFIGNRATGLLNGEPELQIAYSVGVTIASFFVPIFVLLVAFYVVTSYNTVSWWRIGVSGTLSGCAICGMHYLGNASIRNYHCEYVVANIAGASVIAAAASTVALALFFVFKAAWTNSWWRRIGCAFLLAGAVSGMHWCAALGTKYRLVEITRVEDHDLRNTTVIVVSCLSVAACILMAILAISSARTRKGYTSKAQRVTLAAAVFDRYGRILVTPDGLLPSEEVMSTFIQRSQHDVFSTGHPLFHWVFQASRNWSSIASLTEKMMAHLSHLPHHGRNVRTGVNLVDEEGRIVENYDTIFRELFCVAAASLANKMRERLVDVGTLWNDMFATGGAPIRSSAEESESERSGSSNSDMKAKEAQEDMAEKGMAYKTHQSHGSLMILVRKLESNRAVDKLEAVGYRFADLRQVAPIIGATMQIRTNRLEEKLRFMSGHAEPAMLDPGVHVGFFALRGRADETGFDVLVRDHAHNLLPSVGMPLDRLEPSHIKFLRHMEGQSFGAIRKYLAEDNFDHSEQNARGFAARFQEALLDLRVALPDGVFDEAKLSSKVVQVPCISPPNSTKPATCSLITFTLTLPAKSVIKSSRHRFIPLQFLKVQQLVYPNSPHRAAFARSVHREILPILTSLPPTPTARGPLSPAGRRAVAPRPERWSPFRRFRRPHASRTTHDSNHLVSASGEHIASTPSNHSVASMQLYTIHSGDSDVPFDPTHQKSQFEESMDLYAPRKPTVHAQESSLGGIMISSEVTVDVEHNDSIPSPTPTPNEASQMGGRTRSHGNLNVLRQKSQRAVLHREREITALPLDGQNVGALSGTGQMAASYEQAIEMDDVSTVLGVGLSKVVVKKEGEAMTFVDELFAKCIDTPRLT
ncbi:hypothetical protein B0T16DRAFT_455770 [Cercophora newfieldiana]|uniref:MHYT domain-containing protein n=1 Tax=Cercophora newfieldiana TaxID=92897 RepID=A0AA39Y915_9PEZI|nr:hypothetical protein B0T16DRAFT_455770 [Cercophora newfieldiana]